MLCVMALQKHGLKPSDGEVLVTGAAGFIGSCLISKLNDEGYTELVLVDDFSKQEKRVNYEGKKFKEKIE